MLLYLADEPQQRVGLFWYGTGPGESYPAAEPRRVEFCSSAGPVQATSAMTAGRSGLEIMPRKIRPTASLACQPSYDVPGRTSHMKRRRRCLGRAPFGMPQGLRLATVDIIIAV